MSLSRKLFMAEPEANTKFLARYYHRGSWWHMEFFAVDWDDAEAICKKLNLQLTGEHKMTIPAVGGSWLADLICWARNRVSINQGE